MGKPPSLTANTAIEAKIYLFPILRVIHRREVSKWQLLRTARGATLRGFMNLLAATMTILHFKYAWLKLGIIGQSGPL